MPATRWAIYASRRAIEKQAGSGERWLGEVHNQELPDLEAEDIPAALHYAAEAVREYELPLHLPA